MTEYRVAKRTVSHGKIKKRGSYQYQTVEIPDDAEFVEVNYSKPTGMNKPSLKAEIRYLVPVEGDKDG